MTPLVRVRACKCSALRMRMAGASAASEGGGSEDGGRESGGSEGGGRESGGGEGGGGGARVLASRRPLADEPDEDGERCSEYGHDPHAERVAHLLLRSRLLLDSLQVVDQVVELVEAGTDGGRTRHDQVARASPATEASLTLRHRLIPVRHGLRPRVEESVRSRTGSGSRRSVRPGEEKYGQGGLRSMRMDTPMQVHLGESMSMDMRSQVATREKYCVRTSHG